MTGASANGDGLLNLEAAASAAATEAERAPFTFAYKSRRYEVPAMAGWPLKTVRAVALGNLEGALGELIGERLRPDVRRRADPRRADVSVYVDGRDRRYAEPPKFRAACAARFNPDVEALMLEVYGVDVLDPAVSTRRVAVLLERLPPYARRPGEHWSTEAELLAVLADELAQLTWVTLRAHGAKGATRPRPMPRPGQMRAPARPPAPNRGRARRPG